MLRFCSMGETKGCFAFCSMGDLGGSTMYRIAEQTVVTYGKNFVGAGLVISGCNPPMIVVKPAPTLNPPFSNS